MCITMETPAITAFLLLLSAQGALHSTVDPDEQTISAVTSMDTEDHNITSTVVMTSPSILAPPTDPPINCSDTSEWSLLDPRVCFRHVTLTCGMGVQEFPCICQNNCPDEDATQSSVTVKNPNEDFDCENMEGWGDNGLLACLDIIYDVCDLDMERTEYICVCNGICNKTVDELNRIHSEQRADEKRKSEKEHTIIKGVVYGVIFLVGLFGNILVIVTVTKFMGRTTVTNIYICNLAVADLLVILICVPTKAVESIYMIWELKLIGCKIVLWLYFASFMWSAFTLMSMSLERYMVINHPMKAQGMSSFKRTAIIIAGVWLLGIALSLPTYFLAEIQQGTICTVAGYDLAKKRAFYVYIFVAIFLIPSLLMGFAYIRTSITLWKSVQKQQQMKHSADGKKDEKTSDSSGRVQAKENRKKTKKVIRILISVLVVFIVCWAPYLAMQVYRTSYHAQTNLAMIAKLGDITLWFNFLSLANSALNPILYGFLSRQFRMGFLRCLTCNKKGKDPSKSYITTSGGVTSMTSRVTTATTAIPMKSTAEPPEKNGTVPNPAVNEADNKL